VRPSEARHLPQHSRLDGFDRFDGYDRFDFAPPPTAEDTTPFALVPRQREYEADEAVVHVVPETPPRGLRKFDLGSVPASVTPPRSWRKAALFAVGTSAAVICGLAVAAVQFVGSPPDTDTIDALPAFPTQHLPVDDLPVDQTTTTTRKSGTSRSSEAGQPSRPDTVRRTSDAQAPGSSPEDKTGGGTSGPGTSDGEGASVSTQTVPPPPSRTTIGQAPVAPANPEAMGDRTEQYFALVIEDPAAAHQLCTGGMAREGPEGIEARYEGVDRVEVQEITIHRNQAMTTSVVKVVREDGTEAIEERQLTFTWGGDPKISEDSATS